MHCAGDFYEDAFCPGPSTANNRSAWCVPTIGASFAETLATARPDVTVLISRGVDVVSNDTSGIAAALDAVSASDLVVLAVGHDATHIEHEGQDHPDSVLPGIQPQFAAQVFAAAKAKGVPVVMVLINAGQLAIDDEMGQANAIVEAFYPGFGAGEQGREVPYRYQQQQAHQSNIIVPLSLSLGLIIRLLSSTTLCRRHRQGRVRLGEQVGPPAVSGAKLT